VGGNTARVFPEPQVYSTSKKGVKFGKEEGGKGSKRSLEMPGQYDGYALLRFLNTEHRMERRQHWVERRVKITTASENGTSESSSTQAVKITPPVGGHSVEGAGSC